jgi:hypothetical protein
MNYFAHGRHAIDRPYHLAGTAIPDWLNVVDRRIRARAKYARPLLADSDPRVAAIAAGIVRHHHDDAWFHSTRAFAELSLDFTLTIRDLLPADDGFRPSFLGHILVELLLDWELIAGDPALLDGYYAAIDSVDAKLVADVVERMTDRPCELLAVLIPRFSVERFLWDYREDAKLCYRLNQVMRRVKLPLLPAEFAEILPAARRAVRSRQVELLTPSSTPAAPTETD